MQKLVITTALAALLAAGYVHTAQAEQTNGTTATPVIAEAPASNSGDDLKAKWKEKFQRLDTNKDGKIDKNEAKADKDLSKAFMAISKKGKLDEADYIKWQEKLKKKRG